MSHFDLDRAWWKPFYGVAKEHMPVVSGRTACGNVGLGLRPRKEARHIFRRLFGKNPPVSLKVWLRLGRPLRSFSVPA